MTTSILATKLSIPPPRRHVVPRPRLIERLNEGLDCKLTLISAPAGFGKTTLISDWLAGCARPAAWLSLDEGDRDPVHFLTYLVAALQTVATGMGASVLAALQSLQPPPTDMVLAALLNSVARTMSDHFVLVLDDYHLVDTKRVRAVLTFLLEHLPPQMHLIVATREDPHLPLARLRARNHLTEVRAADLRFTTAEAAEFLNQVMGVSLSAEAVAALETRTEGWIAGLQFAALSLKQQDDTQLDSTRFIASFTGSHHFVLDYVVEEVLSHQSASVQTFLLRTSILDRLCGALCDAVVRDSSIPGQATLEYLERANLFIVPLDTERQWYRYHHLFADLLRRRLHQCGALAPSDDSDGGNGTSKREDAAEFHRRASQWYEDQGLALEAFHHAAVAHDVARAARLMEDERMPSHRGAVTALLDWLASLPTAALDAMPSLWVRFAALLVTSGHVTAVEEKLRAAEVTLEAGEEDASTRDLVGQIAAIRAALAISQYEPERIIVQSRRALECLHPNNLAMRTTAHWTLGVAHQLQGDRAAARQAYTDAIGLSRMSRDSFTTILATIGLGNMQEADTQLAVAAQTYRHVLQLVGEPPQPIAGEVHLSLGRICYEWNDLDAAEWHGQQSLQLARLFESVIDRFLLCEVFLARLKLARGDVSGAAVLLAQASQSARHHRFVYRLPEIAEAQVRVLLRRGALAAAARLAATHELSLSQARVHLALGEPAAALAVLEPWRRQVEAKEWEDERLQVRLLQALALQACGEQDEAVRLLWDVLAQAEPGGFVRSFVDEGRPMAHLLAAAAVQGPQSDYIGYIGVLRAAFDLEQSQLKVMASAGSPPPVSPLSPASPAQPLHESISHREVEVLQLIAQGRSNQEISEQLFLAESTVKGHNRSIFRKLQVQRRTEAVARARELGLL
jgi:LuxR family maltose regulon positive regulatory protein